MRFLRWVVDGDTAPISNWRGINEQAGRAGMDEENGWNADETEGRWPIAPLRMGLFFLSTESRVSKSNCLNLEIMFLFYERLVKSKVGQVKER